MKDQDFLSNQSQPKTENVGLFSFVVIVNIGNHYY